MFRDKDKITLTGINVINKEGKIIDYYLPLPIDEDNFSVPDDIVQISFFEYHEGYDCYNYGYEVFKVCVGKITSILEVCNNHEVDCIHFINDEVFNSIKESKEKLCYFDDINRRKNIFAIIKEGDIVVENTAVLKDILILISRNYQNINNSISEIKQCSFDEKGIILQKKRK